MKSFPYLLDLTINFDASLMLGSTIREYPDTIKPIDTESATKSLRMQNDNKCTNK